jgi:hypothetical protein
MDQTPKIEPRETDLFPLDHGQTQRVLRDKVAALTEWLDTHAPDCATEQAHRQEGSRERAYWHHGYLTALRDTLIMLERQVR